VIDCRSYQVLETVSAGGVAASFVDRSARGASDHLPVIADIAIKRASDLDQQSKAADMFRVWAQSEGVLPKWK
jgi:hypothetical protein